MVSMRLHLQTPNTARQLILESVANTFRDEPQPSGSSDARRRSSLEEFCERGQHVNITARSIHCPIHSGFGDCRPDRRGPSGRAIATPACAKTAVIH
jgi:hypothetical protein